MSSRTDPQPAGSPHSGPPSGEAPLADATVPQALAPPWRDQAVAGVAVRRALWSPDRLDAVAGRVAEAGPAALDAVGVEGLRRAWSRAVEATSPDAPSLRGLLSVVAHDAALSDQGLRAALDVMLAGVRGRQMDALLAAADGRRRSGGLAIVVLASNVPALAVQAALPVLALGRPVLIKPSSAEPFWTARFVGALTAAEPRLADAVAAVGWSGGDRMVEERVFRRADRVLAYGGGDTIRDLAERVGEKLLAYGPKTSVALLDGDAVADAVADGLARDIALFDQRGCLSVQAIYTAGDPVGLAEELARALDRLARELPPGPIDPATAAAVHHLRATAAMRGHHLADLPLAAGTVFVDPDPELRPSPGARTVRIHPVDRVDTALDQLQRAHGFLQGVAVAGRDAWALEPDLRRLGVSRCAEPGQLQAVDLSWDNGGVSLLDVLSDPAAAPPER